MRVGVIGYGYWGPNLVRSFAEAPGSQITTVSNLRPERLALARRRYPMIETTTDYCDLLAKTRIDAIAIVTPGSAHFDLAM